MVRLGSRVSGDLGLWQMTGASEAMKVRDSGMPEAAYWETLFDAPLILDRL